jgi:hypothetical protein
MPAVVMDFLALERNNPDAPDIAFPLALAACSPPTAPDDPPTAMRSPCSTRLLRMGVRCAWAYGRFRLPLISAMHRCQLDLGQKRKSAMQTDARIELAPAPHNRHVRQDSAEPHIGREAYRLGPTASY